MVPEHGSRGGEGAARLPSHGMPPGTCDRAAGANRAIRDLEPNDIRQLLSLQEEAYIPELLESPESFRSKMAAYPPGAQGLFQAGTLCAYVFYFPWRSGGYLPLDARSLVLPGVPDCLYIHDLAVSRGCRGLGMAKALLAKVAVTAQQMGIREYMLVAVQQSEEFWENLGFERGREFEYVEGVPATVMFKHGPSFTHASETSDPS